MDFRRVLFRSSKFILKLLVRTQSVNCVLCVFFLFLKMLFTRFIKQRSLFTTLYKESISYLSPTNLNGWWNFGSLALLCLVIQVATGIFLTMHYIPHEIMAFGSV